MWSIWLALSLSHAQDPTVFEWTVEFGHSGELDHDLLLEHVAGRSPSGTRTVRLVDAEGELLGPKGAPGHPAPPDKDGATASWPTDNPGSAEGALSGKAVYLSQCHGWIYYDSLGRFSTQRGNLFDTVEDFHNPEGANQFLVSYLENAGAMVYTVKERDLNPNQAISDNDGEGYSETGSGFGPGPDANQGFADRATFAYGQDPFNTGTTRRFPADGGSVATWVPEVPVDDWYAVYVAWDAHPDHASDAHYRITHPGGVLDRSFDQRVHGSTWQYVDTLWLEQGVSSFKVELVGDSTSSGAWLSADAVRIGGGMGQVTRYGGTTGRPRWEEGAILHTQYNGAPTSVYDPFGNGDGSDPSSRSRWAAWEHPTGEDALYLSWHSNAGGGVGTSVYTWDGAATAGSEELGDLLVEEIVDASRALWDPNWTNRGHRYAQFSEVSPNHNPEMPAALVELAFHDSDTDIIALKSPTYRRDASRAMYRAIVRYFAERDGQTARFAPEPPTGLAVIHGNDGRLEVRWDAPVSGNPFGDAAEGYLVYTSADGRAWGEGREVSGTQLVLDAQPGQSLFVRVAAKNAGGVSIPSQVVGARRASDGLAEVLVVDAFDRLDNGLLVSRDVGPVGTVRGMDLTRMNRGDSAAIHGRSIGAAGYPFDTVSDEFFDDLDLSPYRVIVWVAGEESTADESFSSAQQARIRSFLEAGGRLWATGAEILWDLDYRGDAGDQAFASEVLGATMASDDAGTTRADGVGLLAGAGSLDFGEIDGAPYPVEYPDVLATAREVIATYPDGSAAAALGGGVALFGFPFETIGDEAARDEVAGRVLGALYDGGVDTGPFPQDTGPWPINDDPLGDTGGTDDPRRPLPGGCGCSSSPGTIGLQGAWMLGLLVWAIRRRQS